MNERPEMMDKIFLTKERRKLLAKILSNYATYTLVGLVVGQLMLIKDLKFEPKVLILGVISSVLFLIAALFAEPEDSFKSEIGE